MRSFLARSATLTGLLRIRARYSLNAAGGIARHEESWAWTDLVESIPGIELLYNACRQGHSALLDSALDRRVLSLNLSEMPSPFVRKVEGVSTASRPGP